MAVGLVAAELIQPIFGIENVDLVFLTAVVSVAVRLRPVAVAAGERCRLAVLQFLLSAADLHLHHHRSDQRRGVLLLHADRDPGFQCRGAGAHPGGGGDRPGADHRIALRLQPQACGHRDARRCAVGDRLSDRADAEGAGGAAAARGGRPDREGGLSAGGSARQGRSRRGELGLGQRPHRRPRLRHAAGRQAPVPADADRPRPDRRDRHRRRQDRPAADAGPAPAARRAGRSGRARDRAGAAGRGHGSGQAHRGVRPAARGAVDLDLARSQDAAGLGARRRQHDARSRQRA